MLTKMRMSVDQACEHFAKVCREVYGDPLMSPQKRTARLRTCVEDMLHAAHLPIDLKMTESSGNPTCAG